VAAAMCAATLAVSIALPKKSDEPLVPLNS
jgi:hypothetical protein